MIRVIASVAAIALSAPALPAAAQTFGDFGLEIGAGTDNRSKNASKTDGDAFAYGVVDWTPGGGDFYALAGVEGIDSGGADWESRVMVGWAPQVSGFDLDINAAHKWRLDALPGHDDDAWEYTLNVSRSVGPARARLQYQYSPDSLGSTGSFTWVEARVGWDFTPKLRATAAVGRREQRNAPDYTGWNIGATYALTDTLDLDVRWHDTDIEIPGDRQYAGALVARIGLSF